ncbi:MAG: hypothetical protein HKN13_14470, partial [Rhodothermales bacterium]|nr:hypothetical protein [Rhodothermales bacterium]
MQTHSNPVQGQRATFVDHALPQSTADDPTTSWSRARLALVMHLGISALVTLAVLYSVTFAVRPEAMLDVYSGLLLAVFMWTVGSWLFIRRTLFDLYGLFVVLAFLFHGSYTVLRLFHAEGSIYLLPDLHVRTLADSILIVLLGFVSLHLGALIGISRTIPVVESRLTDEDVNPYLMMLGFLLVLVAVPSMYLNMRTGLSIVAEGGYSALFDETAPSGPLGVLSNL